MGVPWPEGFVGRSLRNRFTPRPGGQGHREAVLASDDGAAVRVTERGGYDVAFR